MHGFAARSLTIRQWTGLLVAACLVPATLAATLLIVRSYQRERQDIENATIGTARALMQAIDRELSSAEGALQSLATSPYLARQDFAAFHAQASDVLRLRPGNTLVLSDQTGRQLVNTSVPFGMLLPMHGNQKQLQHVFETAKTDISDLYTGAVTGNPMTSVDVPAIARGKVKYVLSMQFSSERLGDILAQQHIPPTWVVAILDSENVVVARTREPRRFIGQHATPKLSERIRASVEGSVEDKTLEGIPSVALFSRSSVSNWTVAIGMQRAALVEPLWRTISWLVAGALLLFALGLGLARMIAARMAASIHGLVGPAMALGHGESVHIPPLYLREAGAVGQALLQASHLLAQRTAERDKAERAESVLREAKSEVERREAFLRGIFEEAPDAVFLLAPDGRVVRVNAEAEHLFGYSQEALSACTADDLICDAREVRFRERVFGLPGDGEGGTHMQLRARRRDGTSFPVDVMARPFHTVQGELAIVTMRDVTERVATQEQLNTLNRRLELAAHAGGVAVWEWDLKSGVLTWDARMYELYAVRPQAGSRTYQMWSERVHPADRKRAEREAEEALSGHRDYATEFRIVWPDGQIRFIKANAIVTRDAAGQPLRLTGANIDITESRRKEATIRAALGEKEILLKELYHRVKNNLQVITSLFNMQVRTLPEGPARTALTESAGRVRAMALVHEKLYQSGNLSSIALDTYVSDLCLQLRSAGSAEQNGIALVTEVEPLDIGLEMAVPLGLILNELLANCLKHGFPDGRRGRVVVHIERKGTSSVLLSVCDDGIGFPEGMEPGTSGTLGLKLVAALSKQLRGQFSIENRGGACASLLFPFEPAHADVSLKMDEGEMENG